MSAGVLHCSEIISGMALTILAAKDETTDFAAPRMVSERQMDKVTFNRAPSAELNVSGLFSRFVDELDGWLRASSVSIPIDTPAFGYLEELGSL
ncbi:hypothetical protein [Delftia sp. PS-11]|uniref:hypothetical protein n=1 Tax=Delftia sp. PS-11 TaxID=2767222 RepID=UPI00245619C8|nr:hypothetical protein [Delftia sp. PS-11]KAJ8744873.1 hypothetical protein H9T68_10390 [Delftia sp. PS-11]